MIDQYSKTVADRVPEVLDYSVEEILTQVEFDLPAKKQEKEKLDNERVMIKQLLNNIEKNRVKWRKDVFESETLSLARKMALQSVKSKIDQQATLLEEENLEVKEKCDTIRRQLEMLASLKTKCEIVQKERSDLDRRNALIRDAQVTFDKYLRLYAKDSKTFKR